MEDVDLPAQRVVSKKPLDLRGGSSSQALNATNSEVDEPVPVILDIRQG